MGLLVNLFKFFFLISGSLYGKMRLYATSRNASNEVILSLFVGSHAARELLRPAITLLLLDGHRGVALLGESIRSHAQRRRSLDGTMLPRLREDVNSTAITLSAPPLRSGHGRVNRVNMGHGALDDRAGRRRRVTAGSDS